MGHGHLLAIPIFFFFFVDNQAAGSFFSLFLSFSFVGEKSEWKERYTICVCATLLKSHNQHTSREKKKILNIKDDTQTSIEKRNVRHRYGDP